MSKIFLSIYDWFEKHPRMFYSVLVLCVALCVAMATQISLQENIINFFGSNNDKENALFDNIKAKDRIVVMLSGEDPDSIIQAADIFEENLQPLHDEQLIRSVTANVDEDAIDKCISFVYDYLPIFLSDDDFAKLEQRISDKGIEASTNRVYQQLTSPSGMVLSDILLKDPLGIGGEMLKKFEQLNPNLQYEIYESRLFTKGLSTMLVFIEPSFGMGNTDNNDRLVFLLEQAANASKINNVEIEYIGGPVVAVHNARQIKQDTMLTMSIALVFILLMLFLSFRSRWSIPLLIIPPAFGALFALAMVWLIQGEISVIAIGAGSVVLGISLSYSIHIIAHVNHISSPRLIIEELATPLTIGSLTTIGAFAALTFTSSALLQDMGLFSVFALIGTTIFCLIFLPHFLKNISLSNRSILLDRIERVVGYRYDKNKWIVALVFVSTFIALFFWQDVRFNDDMLKINFMPEHLAKAEAKSKQILGDNQSNVYIVTVADDVDSLVHEYSKLDAVLTSHAGEEGVTEIINISDFFISSEVQRQRIERWNAFWEKHRSNTISQINAEAEKCGFRSNAFSAFEELINKDYVPCEYTEKEIGDIPAISEWISNSDSSYSALCKISIGVDSKPIVYGELEKLKNTIIVDRAYFSAKMVESTNDDFNYILFISSAIVFIALLLSYGRIELALLAFLPMCISWVIILGMMSLCNIEFNIVNIILATFIFGIGDDFSIFTIDGLLQEYKNGRKILDAHKTAIFFSAFTAIVGMGVLIFAEHPALKSIALISVLGLSVVVFVSYTVQPVLFRMLISAQTNRGEFPYTILSILNTAYCFISFLLGCILVELYALILIPLPLKRSTKKASFHKLIYYFTRLFLKTRLTVKTIRENPYNETYERPAMIIANHQSFIDILLLLSTTPKIIMITNSWVWNSPFFGWIVRYADFHHTGDGYENLATSLQERVAEGYSVVVFPEGTRSVDCSIQRFHKGAFYLAKLLNLDVLPMIIYGAGQVSSKRQGFYIKRGIIVTKTMQRLPYGDTSMGVSYQEQSKNYRHWYQEQYRLLNDKCGRVSNPYFRDTLIKNYIYKGPVLEWYMRVKCRLDGYYDMWDKIIPRNATITDVGCGYGQMCFMLGMLSPDRTVLGIDYDNDKIELAKHSFLCKKNIDFRCDDMRYADIPASDAILFNDSLHYVDKEAQLNILTRSIKSLKEGGIIVVRDGDASKDGQSKIDRTEVWSTEILKFNKTTQRLEFANSQMMEEFARQNHLDVRVRSCDKDSSETLYVFSRRV